MKLYNLLSMVVISAVAANQINVPTTHNELASNHGVMGIEPEPISSEGIQELNMDAAPDTAADYRGFLLKAKEDPIGFVSWKYEFPLPNGVPPFARPFIKNGIESQKAKLANAINKHVKAFRNNHSGDIISFAHDFCDFFDGKEDRLDKLHEIVIENLKKAGKGLEYGQAFQIFFDSILSGEIQNLSVDFTIELLKYKQPVGKSVFNGFVKAQKETNVFSNSLYKNYVSKVKRGYK